MSEQATDRATAAPREPVPVLVLSVGDAPPLRTEGDVFRMGSHVSNDLVLDDELVSPFHCRLERLRDVWAVRDDGSRNGTMLDGVVVRDADLTRPIARLTLGRSVVRVAQRATEAFEPISPSPGLGRIAGRSLVMRTLFKRILQVAPTSVDVLLEGESGTGKELCARELVQHSRRSGGPFIVISCGAANPSVFERELFGPAPGSLAGADRDRRGAFEHADGGTLLLDEVGELSPEHQSTLLRALGQRETRRVGEPSTRRVDVRVIAATKRDLPREVSLGRFRKDLFHRLAVAHLRVPPLRERLDDIPLLIDSFLSDQGATAKRSLLDLPLAAAVSYHWPGNVRELQSFVERTALFGNDLQGGHPLASWGPGGVDPRAEVSFGVAKQVAIDLFERQYLGDLIAETRGNVSEASRRARVDRMHLHRLLQRHRLRGKESSA